MSNNKAALQAYAEQGYQLRDAPPCMTERAWEHYQLISIKVKSNTSKVRSPVDPCLDCDKAHAKAMALQGKCNGGRVG